MEALDKALTGIDLVAQNLAEVTGFSTEEAYRLRSRTRERAFEGLVDLGRERSPAQSASPPRSV